MRCEDARLLIDGYVDGELDLVRNVEMERHLEICPDCAPARQRAMSMRTAIREQVRYYRAPVTLEKRVRESLRGEAAQAISENVPKSRPAQAVAWRWLAAAAVLAFAVLIAARGARLLGPPREELIAQQVLDGHVRSMMANHLTDVTSTDQHTVKPWFDGKLPFAPPVNDFAPQGYPLIGGRLDYLDGHPVAALVYMRRLHVINVFIWPAGGGETHPALQVRQGYNLVEWRRGGMNFWAASDLGADELQSLVDLLRK